ncbi:MAG: hypothetical protein K2X87_25465 [Gemmataceae bacterium]|nr:hypothetical protein [Gemmataceae bacterium]
MLLLFDGPAASGPSLQLADWLSRQPWMAWDYDADDVALYVPLTAANYADPRVSDKWGYFNDIIVDLTMATGTTLGTLVEPATGRTFTLTGTGTAGFAVNSTTGVITISDDTLITAAGTRSINLVVSDLGSFAFTITVVSGTETGAGSYRFYADDGNDANDGKTPSTPKRNTPYQWDGAANQSSGTHCFKRGSTFPDRVLAALNSRTYRAYGDPSQAQPVIDGRNARTYQFNKTVGGTTQGTSTSVFEQQRQSTDGALGSCTNVVVQDLHIMGGFRPFSIGNTAGTPLVAKRITLSDNTDDANAQGFFINTKGGSFTLRWPVTLRISGDSFYANENEDSELGFFDFCTPEGGAADNAQVTEEGVSGDRSHDMWIHDGVMRRGVVGSSLKGGLVIAGLDDYLAENLYAVGGYFGFGIGGYNGTVRNVFVPYSRLPDGNANAANVFAAGIANAFGITNVSIQDGWFLRSYSGMILSSTGPQTRQDLEYLYNTVAYCTKFFRQTLNAAGLCGYSLAVANTNQSPNVGAGVTGSDPGTKYATFDFVGTVEQASLPRLPATASSVSGTAQDGLAVTVTPAPAPAGYTPSYQWRWNALPIALATSASYTIPPGSSEVAANIPTNMPDLNGLNVPQLSCLITWADADGNKCYDLPKWGDGSPYARLAASPYVRSVQAVSITIPAGSTSATQTVTSVSTTRSVIFWDGQLTDNTSLAPDRTTARLTLTDATTVTATRAASSGTNGITVKAYLVEFQASVVDSVEYGTVSIGSGASSNTATVASVDVTRSTVFYLGSTTTSNSSGTAEQHLMTVTLTDATTVTAATSATSTATRIASFCVVQWASGATTSVNAYTLTDSTAATAPTKTITSVDTTRSLVIYNGCLGAATGMTDNLSRLSLTNSTTVTVTRGGTGATSRTAAFTVVEFAAALIHSIQRGSTTLTGAVSADSTVTAVETARAFVNFGGHSSNVTNNFNTSLHTAELLDPDTVRCQRGLASSGSVTGVPAWEVVRFN